MTAPGFVPRFPWLGPDLQTLRNLLVRGRRTAAPGEPLELALRDGSGDRLLAELDRPEGEPARPTALLVHGLTGCCRSDYMLATSSCLRASGHAVVRLNLRGSAPGRRLAQGHYHAGRSADLADAIAALPAELTRAGLVAVGFSLGGNMLLKHLGEAGRQTPIRAAATVSAPLDLAACSARLRAPRNLAYHHYLLRRMKAEALAPGARVSAAERDAIRSARDIRDYDDRFIAPRHGFAGAADYYASCSARSFLAAIAVPTLLVHALDDPWVPGATYESFDWRTNPRLRPLLSPRGGHLGFHGRGGSETWHDRAIAAFFAAGT